MNVFRRCTMTQAGHRSLTEREAQFFFARSFLHLFLVRDFHICVTRSAVLSISQFVQEMFKLRYFISRLRVFIMAGLWSHPDDFLLLPEEEESDGDMNVVGPGRSSSLVSMEAHVCFYR